MPRIRYVCYYGTDEDAAQGRNFVLSAAGKLRYLFDCMRGGGFALDILSASQATGPRPLPRSVRQLDGGTTLTLPLSIGTGGLARRLLDRLIGRVQLLHALVFGTRREDIVVVYHSLGYMRTVRFARWLRRFALVIEAEEIYGDVSGDARVARREMAFFARADAYIFPTELLNEKINGRGKPFAIAYGTYRAEPDIAAPPGEGTVHAVYAGTFDPRKGGAAAAIGAAAFLGARYHIHILGFGSPADVQAVRAQIDQAAARGGCAVTYGGLLSGEAYARYIQGCYIGLSTQTPAGGYNETSFPSKVLSYMANGLRVVSIRLRVLERSAIDDLLYYYDEDSPQAIARAIEQADLADAYDSRQRLRQLDGAFCARLHAMLGALGAEGTGHGRA